MLWYFLGGIAYCTICGFATKIIINNKGYSQNWFWWGFFFCLIALIVACAKPRNERNTEVCNDESILSKAANNIHKERLLSSGGWECSCGTINAHYVSSCGCGMSKSEIVYKQRKLSQDNNKAVIETKSANIDELSKITVIKEYKALLDAGVLSQEEFEAKKKQLLGL